MKPRYLTLTISLALTLIGLAGPAGAHEPAIKPATSTAPHAGKAQMEQARGAAAREAKARAYFTDTVLTTHEGEPVRFFSDVLKDKVVLISFVFTHCGDACPLIVHKLAQVKRELGALFGTPVRFVSLSIDPARDTPAALAQFAQKFDAVHPEWYFLTGAPPDVERVVQRLGAWREDIETHYTGIIIGNVKAVRWRKVRPDAPAPVIAENLRLLAGASKRLGATVPVPFVAAGGTQAR